MGMAFCVFANVGQASAPSFSMQSWFANVAEEVMGKANFSLNADYAVKASSETKKPEAIAENTDSDPVVRKASIQIGLFEPVALVDSENSEASAEAVVPAFRGYLPEMGVNGLRLKRVGRPVDRSRLIAGIESWQSADNEAEKSEVSISSDEQLRAIISAILSEKLADLKLSEIDADRTENSNPATSAANSELKIKSGLNPAEQISQNSNYTEFLNPDDIVLYFEEQLQADGVERNSIGVPLAVPVNTGPQVTPYPSRAELEKN